MGSSSSKFHRYLQNGDEYAALQIFQNSPELNLDPNSTYGDSSKHNTPLHLVARHAMKPLLRIFLTELNGNPNKPNSHGETALHLVCQGTSARSIASYERRVLCLNMILQWRSSNEKVDKACVDSEGNTALHFAAASGLKKCVEILISHGAPLFTLNNSLESACDLAEKYKHCDTAEYLERKMLFFTDELDKIQPSYEEVSEEAEKGLRAQDLQEAKDQLLVEASNMLHVPLFTAEVLLRNHEWSLQGLLDAWMKDPIACCQDAGVSPTSSAVNFCTTQDSLKQNCEQIQNEYQNESLNSPVRTVIPKEEAMCEICMETILSEDLIQVPCLHQFCKSCWETYLTSKIEKGEVHHILCPASECPHMVPVDVIERVVSPDMVKRYLQFDLKAFVESNPSMKWCPFPGCARAVKIPKFEKVNEEILALSFTTIPSLSHAVDCGNGHYFCWECLGIAHAPSGCEKWKEWQDKIAEIKPQELKNTYAETEQAENNLWMAQNSKPCPNCKCRIQKNEGCNHMRCSKCKYEYCWVCLDSWKKHGQGTGGYFRCDRYEAVKRAEIKTGAIITQAEEHNRHMQELKRFMDYYKKFKDHEDSYKIEEPFLKRVHDKIPEFLASMESTSKNNGSLSFLDDAFYELLRARRILCGAYVYGFYLEDNGYNKTIFEYLQDQLEDATNKLCSAVARNYIQTPQTKIIQMTSLVKRKRLDLLTAVHKGLIPPETPPNLRKSRKRRLPGLMGLDPEEDPSTVQDKMQSLKNIDPNDPWIIDETGKHTNVAAVYDWPDCDSDDDETSNPYLSTLMGFCSRDGCYRPRAKNCRTGEMHEFCSLRCKHWDIIKSSDSKANSSAHIDPDMDILIALELSKLQDSCMSFENDDSFLQKVESMNLNSGSLTENANAENPESSTNLQSTENTESNSKKQDTQNPDCVTLYFIDEQSTQNPESNINEQCNQNTQSNNCVEGTEHPESNGNEQHTENLESSLSQLATENLESNTDEPATEVPDEPRSDNPVSNNGEIVDEAHESNINDEAFQDDIIDFNGTQHIDNCRENDTGETDMNSPSMVAKSNSKNSFSPDNENSGLNFYLKNSCDLLSKNLNVNVDKNCSKTDKELLKIFIENSKNNVSCNGMPSVEENIAQEMVYDG